MNRIKMALAAFSMLSMLALFFLPHGAAAQGSGRAANVSSSTLAQATTPTPDAMMEQPTATPDAMMAEGTATPDAMMAEGTATPGAAMMAEATNTPQGAMMEHPTATAGAAMMEHPGDNMANGTLPTTGSSDYSGLLWLGAGAIALLAGGLGLRRVRASRK